MFLDGDFANGQAVEIYQEYQDRLKVLNAVDFGDLLLLCLDLFSNNADVLARYHRQFKYILVDEYQDTNFIQSKWLNLLSEKTKNLCCVGDDDQSIYSWRGAEIKNFLEFDQVYKNTKVIRLEQNYRSSQNILSVASNLISNNQNRVGKTLTTNMEEGDLVKLNCYKNGKDEAVGISDEIEKKLINEDITILDVRGADEFANSHIPGSIFIGLDGRFAPWVGEILEDVFKQMILIVPKGREKEAVLRLSRVGFDNVLGYLKGGIQNWIDSGKQITKVENEPALNFSDHNLKQIKNILDVRSKSEYSSESLEKSLNIPLPELIHSLNKVNFNDKFYVHCKGGYRSMIAASILLSKGISKFANIPGGFDEIKKFQA